MFNLSLSQYIHTCFILQGHSNGHLQHLPLLLIVIQALSVCATWKWIYCSRPNENVWRISLSVKSNLFPSPGTWQQPSSTSPPHHHPELRSLPVFHLKISFLFKIQLCFLVLQIQICCPVLHLRVCVLRTLFTKLDWILFLILISTNCNLFQNRALPPSRTWQWPFSTFPPRFHHVAPLPKPLSLYLNAINVKLFLEHIIDHQ